MSQTLKLDGEGVNLKISARASFPTLFRAKAQSPGQEPKFSLNGLLHKATDAESITDLKNAIQMVADNKWGKGKAPKNVIFGGDRCCLKEASGKDYDGYDESHLVVSASSSKPVGVVDRDLTPLTEQSGKPYPGCFVRMSIRVWAQDNQYGKRVNCQLRAVQFVKDGDTFGSGQVDASKEFESLADEGGFTE